MLQLSRVQDAHVEQYKRLTIETYETSNRKTGKIQYCVKVWRGKQSKPFANYYMMSAAQRDSWIDEQKASEILHEEYEIKREQERKESEAKMLAELQVGTLLHYSWGYDQTNAEFYQVVERKGKTVKIRKIAARAVESSQGFMSERVQPVKDQFISEDLLTKRIGAYGLSMKHGAAFICTEDQSFYSSWYA